MDTARHNIYLYLERKINFVMRVHQNQNIFIMRNIILGQKNGSKMPPGYKLINLVNQSINWFLFYFIVIEKRILLVHTSVGTRIHICLANSVSHQPYMYPTSLYSVASDWKTAKSITKTKFAMDKLVNAAISDSLSM